MVRIRYKEALGLETKRGKPAIGKKPEKEELEKLYAKESKSIREVSEVLGCTKDMVYRCLQEYSIERRERLFKSKLKKCSFEYIEKEIRKKGFKQAASDLNVEVHTLRVHFNRRKINKNHSVA